MATAMKTRPGIKILPLEDRVVILPQEDSEAMRGRLYIPDTAKEKPTQGEVIAVGPGRMEKGARVPMELKVGDQVIYGKYSGTPYTIDGDEYVIIKSSDVLAKLS
jgi:chaperonin GroES